MAISKIKKFSATWCGPCRVLKQNLEGFTRVPVEEIDVEANIDETTKYNIRNVPVLVYLDENGNEVDRTVGLVTVQKINEIIDKHETD